MGEKDIGIIESLEEGAIATGDVVATVIGILVFALPLTHYKKIEQRAHDLAGARRGAGGGHGGGHH